jgi:hypothetical protein
MKIAGTDPKLRKGQVCEARYYVAEYLIAQKKPAEARGLLEKARDECPRDYVEYFEAVAELGRLGP